MSGALLSFEGGEASGKSTQARRLADALGTRGRDVLLVREPGSTSLGERVRELLLHSADVPLSPEAQALLFSAARAQLVRDVIRPALVEGKVVIADRFYDSTVAYQGYALGADVEGLGAMTAFAVGGLRPARTFILDLSIEAARRRRQLETDRRWDRFEARDEAFHQRLRDGYLRIAAADPERVVVIDADRDEETVAADILASAGLVLGVPSRR